MYIKALGFVFDCIRQHVLCLEVCLFISACVSFTMRNRYGICAWPLPEFFYMLHAMTDYRILNKRGTSAPFMAPVVRARYPRH
jgi:hypothetical protein